MLPTPACAGGADGDQCGGDPTGRRSEPPAAGQLRLAVVLTCTSCDQTYQPTTEALARGRLGCPDPDCGGWVFSAALTVPTTGHLAGEQAAADGGGAR